MRAPAGAWAVRRSRTVADPPGSTVSAIELRKDFAGEWALILNGALTALFGILMIMLPLAGLLSLIWIIGVYSVFFGTLLLTLALRLRARWQATAAAARTA
jgi:hypothetical protein